MGVLDGGGMGWGVGGEEPDPNGKEAGKNISEEKVLTCVLKLRALLEQTPGNPGDGGN